MKGNLPTISHFCTYQCIMPAVYDKAFYTDREDGSYTSAKSIIPIIYHILQPKSVMDLGCGTGTWLSVFKQLFNLADVLGVDGDYVKRELLKINNEEFISYDLTKPFNAPRRFDMAMSVEVGEHLPETAADNFVSSLTNAADIVLFSAAVPGQIGTFHINEQYPEYWAQKFISRGYVAIDMRKEFWNLPNVDWWYKQNIILYIKEDLYRQKYESRLRGYKEKTDPEFLTRIHPEMLSYFQKEYFRLQTFNGFVRNKLYPLKKWLSNK